MKANVAVLFAIAASLQTACFSDTRFSRPKVAVSGQPQRVALFTSLNPDCTVRGFVTVRLLSAPEHGQVSIVQGSGYSSFPAGSQNYACNTKQTEGMAVTYVSTPGYLGSDAATIEVIYPGGNYKTYEYAIIVK